MNFYLFEFWQSLRAETYQIYKNSEPLKLQKIAVLELPDSSKLISRKNWMTEISWNFHTVLTILQRKMIFTLLSYCSRILHQRSSKRNRWRNQGRIQSSCLWNEQGWRNDLFSWTISRTLKVKKDIYFFEYVVADTTILVINNFMKCASI